jgi:hypothetical protein
MKSWIISGIMLLATLLIGWTVLARENQMADVGDSMVNAGARGLKNRADDEVKRVNSLLDFSDYPGGPADEWLRSKGFIFARGAKDRQSVEFQVNGKGLLIQTKRPVDGFLFNESVHLDRFSRVRIEWGVIEYPKDASYEKRINNEALMLYISFGEDKISSGHLLVPNKPYFIGLFLGEYDVVNKAYMGRYFHKGGRFVCVGNPRPNETVVTEFDLVSAFRKYFGKEDVPAISGIHLGVDTSSSGGDGRAAAFIKRIEFL